MDVKVLGKVIGTASGWDQADTWAIYFYEFKPNALGKRLLVTWRDDEDCILFIDFEEGKVAAQPQSDQMPDRELFPNWRIFEIGEGS